MEKGRVEFNDPNVRAITTVTPHAKVKYIHIECENCKRLQAENEALGAEVEALSRIAALTKELCSRIEDGRQAMDTKGYDIERAYEMAEHQAVRVREVFQSLQAAQTSSDGATTID